jgi:regulatory protein
MPARGRRVAPGPLSGTITGLVVRSGRPERTVVHLEGRPAADIATEVVREAGLRKGGALSEETLAALLHMDEPYRARSRALRLLATRDRSRAEVDSRLRQAGFTADTVGATIGWLGGLGYLDDARFAERYVAEKTRNGWGPRRIRSELMRKGIQRSVLDAALAGADEDEQPAVAQTEMLVELVRNRFGRQWVQDRVTAERRLVGFLTRRGYDWEDVTRVVRGLEAALESGSGEAPESRGS